MVQSAEISWWYHDNQDMACWSVVFTHEHDFIKQFKYLQTIEKQSSAYDTVDNHWITNKYEGNIPISFRYSDIPRKVVGLLSLEDNVDMQYAMYFQRI